MIYYKETIIKKNGLYQYYNKWKNHLNQKQKI